MNHIPDSVLSAIDQFGADLLTRDTEPLNQQLRNDLRVRISLNSSAGQARIEYSISHTQSHAHLRAYGSYVETIVDAIEKRLQSWGIDPPLQYEFVESHTNIQTYSGDAPIR